MVFEDFCIYFMIALETDLWPILALFWSPKSSQNRTQNGSERYQNSLSFLIALQDLQKSIFWPTWPQHGPNLAPTWPPRWAQVGSKMASEPNQKRYRKRRWSLNWFWTDFGPIWNRFWTDFGQKSFQNRSQNGSESNDEQRSPKFQLSSRPETEGPAAEALAIK